MARLASLLVVLASMTLAVVAAPTPAVAQDLEYSVKANYLVRFAAFVDWPPQVFANTRSPVTLCVAGRDPFGAALDRAAQGQTAHGRALTVRRVGTPGAVAGCHILYMGQGAAASIGAPQPRLGVLVVTDDAVAPQRGGLHFVLNDARVRFHIDAEVARRSGLSVSSRLLNLALSVRGG